MGLNNALLTLVSGTICLFTSSFAFCSAFYVWGYLSLRDLSQPVKAQTKHRRYGRSRLTAPPKSVEI